MPKSKNKRRSGPIRGRIVESRTGKALSGLRVLAFDADNQGEDDYLGESKTDKAGKFAIRFRSTKAAKTARSAFPEGGPDLVFHIFENDGTPLRITDPYVGAERFTSILIKIRKSDRDELNKIFGDLLEQAMLRPEFLKLAASMLARKYDRDPTEVYETLRDADPFGIDPFTWRTTVCCILNDLMDTFKQTPLGSQLLFDNGTYQHLWHVPSVRGFIRGPVLQGAQVHEGVEGREELDEDFNFKIEPTLPTFNRFQIQVIQSGRISARELAELNDPTSEYFGRLHCEITPCDQVGDMRRFMAALRRRAREAEADHAAGRTPRAIQVELSGELTWDGRHGPWPGHLEIHPVNWARIL